MYSRLKIILFLGLLVVLGITYRVKSQFLLSELVDLVMVKAESSGSTLFGKGIPIENYSVDKLGISRLKAYRHLASCR
jgi:hypothetical protein